MVVIDDFKESVELQQLKSYMARDCCWFGSDATISVTVY
jgi:hypothetical protein